MRPVADYYEWLRGRDVALVGPAGALVGSGLGEWIDQHTVVRLNYSFPMPEHLVPDYGRRTDVVYKRILGSRNGVPTIPSPQHARQWVEMGLQWAVVAKANESEPGRWYQRVGSIIPSTDTGETRTDLIRVMGNRPLVGMIATLHLLRAPIRSLTVVNCDFYYTGYYRGYRNYPRPETAQIARTHDPNIQANFLRILTKADDRLKLDAVTAHAVIGRCQEAGFPCELPASSQPDTGAAAIPASRSLASTASR